MNNKTVRKVISRLKRLAEPLANLKKRWAPGRRLIEKLPPWVTANRVTVGRALLVIPVMMLIEADAFWPALVTFSLAMLLDAVDGAIADVRGQHSTLGAFLDPLADKILVCFTLIALLHPLPLIFLLPVAVICLGAVGLTLIRVIKMIFFWRRESRATPLVDDYDGRLKPMAAVPVRGAAVAAKLAGKAKCWIEVVSIVCLLIGLGTAVAALVWVGFGLLLGAMTLGAASLWSQLKDLF